MNEMVERVARGLRSELRRQDGCGGVDEQVDGHIDIQSCDDAALARVAIAAMREPTEGMLKAAHIKMEGVAIRPGAYWAAMEQRWRQMIDEALK